MIQAETPTPRHNQVTKWIGAALFIAIIAFGALVIHQASKEGKNETADTVATKTIPTPQASVTPQSTATNEPVSPAATKINESSDLTNADRSLDSMDIDGMNADLNQNDSDSASF